MSQHIDDKLQIALFLCILLAASTDLLAFDKVEAYIHRLDRRVPEVLLRYNVPSAAVAVVHDGQIYTRTYGAANLQSGQPVSATTLYNVASISKLVTAWAVMRLVQEGKVSLDAPVSKYITRWKLPDSEWNSQQVTVRRLLSHTAGLSMPAVPQYGPEERVPSMEEMLSNTQDPVRVTQKPGTSNQYSGGGFGVLQLLVEEVTKQPFAQYVESTVLKPLGMHHSTFRTPETNDPAVATPYDKALQPLPHYRFAAQGAAGLYTSVQDMAIFALAGMKGNTDAPLQQATIDQMYDRIPVEKSDLFGYGLGYSIGPLPGDGESAGHAGSNDGWTAIFETIPATGDALVVLLNRSDAFPVYRDLLCEWVESIKGKPWPGFCDDRSVAWKQQDTEFVDGLFTAIQPSDPATAVLIATADGVVYRKAFGSRDLESKAIATPDTPFYVASLAKSITAIAAMKLVEEGRWRLSETIGTYLPDLPSYIKPVTLDQLLSHTSGVPGYQSLIDWSKYEGMDNAKAISLLSQRAELEFPAGSQYKYSNSGAVLIASAMERLTGKSYAEVVREKVLNPAGMKATVIYDGSNTGPADRSLGYAKENGAYVLSDYQTITIGGKPFPFRSTTVGAGGIYSTLDDIYALDRAISAQKLLSLPVSMMATSPRTAIQEKMELPDTVGHGAGWFTSIRYKTAVIWNTGDFSAHKSALVRIPKEKLTIIVLTSAGAPEPEDIALQIADHLLNKEP